jgi:hypothetical protein
LCIIQKSYCKENEEEEEEEEEDPPLSSNVSLGW